MAEPAADRRERDLPEHVTTPLLTLIVARSMDEDYAHVAQQRAAAGDVRPQVARPHLASVAAIAVLGIMAAVVAAQTDRQADVDELSRAALVEQINSRSDDLQDLQGRVAVKFIISPTGAVQTAAMASSSLGNAKAEQCIVNAVRRWTFPSPEGGGIVVVTYPFVLEQTGG